MAQLQPVEFDPFEQRKPAPRLEAMPGGFDPFAAASVLPPGVMPSLIAVESSGNPNAVSSKGAAGLTQLMPGTAREVGVSDVFDPAQNVAGGRAYLEKMMGQFGNLDDALAGYVWGPGNMRLWVASGRDPARMPQQVRDYIAKVKSGMATAKPRLVPVQSDPFAPAGGYSPEGYPVLSAEQAAQNRQEPPPPHAATPPSLPSPDDLMLSQGEAAKGPPPSLADQLKDFGNSAITRPMRNLGAGYLASASGSYNLGANAMMLLNKAAETIAKASGANVPGREHFAAAEKWLRDTAKRVAPDATQIDDDLISKIYQGLGSAPLAIGEYGIGTAVAGPVAGFAAVDALRAADKGPKEAGLAAVKGALLGGTFKATEPLARLPRSGALATIGGTQAAAEGGDAKDITAGAATLGILGAVTPGAGRLTGQQALRDAGAAYGKKTTPETERVPEPMPEPPAVVEPTTPDQPTGGDVVVTPRGRRVGVEYEVREAGDLITSHGPDLVANPRYPSELQPRDRSRAASAEQIGQIAGKLSPELLGRSPSAAEGAPIVGPDGIVESGNARVLAIRRAYDQGLPGGEAYKTWLQGQGFDVTGYRAPVLVRRRTSELAPEDRIAFTQEANERTTGALSSAEQAGADARAVSDGLLSRYKGGDLLAAGNRDFVRGFLDSVVPTSERGALYTREGGLSQEGQRRIENALFAKAYEDTRAVASLREDADSGFRSIGGAMVDAAGAWAKMRSDVLRGVVPRDLDITQALRDAVDVVRRARQSRTPVADVVNQGDLVSGGVSPIARDLLRLMFNDDGFRRPVSRDRFAGSLRFYADEARKAQTGPSLLPDQPRVTPEGILRIAHQRAFGGLLDALPPVAESRTPADAFDTPRQSRLEPVSGDPFRQSKLEAVEGDPFVVESRVGVDQMAPGVNYTGFVHDMAGVAGATAKAEPIRRENVLRPLMEAFDVPLYQGRITGKGTLGFFRRPVEEVRIKNPSDLETTAHEIAHLLDYRVPEIRAQWNPPTKANETIREELRGVSYDRTKLYEGFAEFVRLWATQAAQAQAKAPNFHRWFESFLDRSDYGPALRRAQKEMTDWFSQDALMRAKSKIGDVRGINDGLTSFADKFRQAVADDLHGILRAERDLTGKVSPVGPYETARLVRAAQSITEGAILYGAPKVKADGSHAFEGRGLKDILDPVAKNLDDFLMYSVGRSARELMGQGREHLFTRNEIDAMVKLETPEFRKAFEEYQGWNKAILDFAETKGLINPAVRKLWKRVDYLPFHRVGQPGTFSPVPGDWRGIQALTGGSQNLRDVLGNMIGNASTLIEAALKNEARQKVANLVQLQGGAKFMAKIPSEDKHVKVHRLEIERAILEALGVKDKRALDIEQQKFLDDVIDNLSPMVWLTQKGQPPKGNNVVAVLRSGKPEYYEVADPLLFRSLESLSRPHRNWLVNLLSIPRRVGQASITLAFDFMAANAARDTLMGFVMSKHGFKPFLDSARGFRSRVTSDQNYKDFIANGGGFASYLVDETAFRTNLERFYSSKGIDLRAVWNAPSKMLLGLERMADAFEMATRLGEFKKATRKGENSRHAAYSAREVSTDFAMRGDSAALGFMYDTVIFLKAAVNGVDRFYRGMAHDPNKINIAAKTALIALASMGLYSLNRGNPLYDDLEDWDKDNHWHLFVPTGAALRAAAGGDALPPLADRYHHFRYPKIWEIGAVASIAERTIGGFLDNQPKELAKNAGRIVANLFKFEYVPQALAPLYEQAINRNRFTDRPIESEATKDLQPWARFDPYTSETLRALGESQRHLPVELQLSPNRLEALLRGYLNTWAMYGLSLSDAAMFDNKPDARLDQMPVIRRFYSQEPARHTKHMTDFYDALREATEARRTLRFMDRIHRKELGDELENTRANLEYNQLTGANRSMQYVRKDLGRVQLSKSLEDMQQMALDRAEITNRRDLPGQLQMQGKWDDLGALKAWLRDDLIVERNRVAKEVMQDIKGRRAADREGKR